MGVNERRRNRGAGGRKGGRGSTVIFSWRVTLRLPPKLAQPITVRFAPESTTRVDPEVMERLPGKEEEKESERGKRRIGKEREK